MNASEDLFRMLRSFRSSPDVGKTPERSLIDYCQGTLGGVERVHFDFKEKKDSTKPDLDDDDRRNLAKAVSGFANSAGGVLVWGIQDETLAARPIDRVKEFIDSVLRLCHQVTAPAVPGIDGDYIPADSDPLDGFGLIFVPESQLPPHRVVLSIYQVQNHYYVRTGSSFTVASHSQLEDMFGRRPRPKLVLNHSIEIGVRFGDKTEVSVTLAIENTGRGIARFPFLEVEVLPPHGLSRWGLDGNGHFGLSVIENRDPRGDDRNFGAQRFGSQDGYVIHSGVSHRVTKAIATVSRRSRYETEDLRIRYSMAAEGVPLQVCELLIPSSKLIEVVELSDTAR